MIPATTYLHPYTCILIKDTNTCARAFRFEYQESPMHSALYTIRCVVVQWSVSRNPPASIPDVPLRRSLGSFLRYCRRWRLDMARNVTKHRSR
jgi:hypothetical protein